MGSDQYVFVNKQMNQLVLLWFKTGMEKEVHDVVLSLMVDQSRRPELRPRLNGKALDA